MRVEPDYGERGVDEWIDAMAILPPGIDPGDAVSFAVNICRARLGRVPPDWTGALSTWNPQGAPQ